MNTVTRLSSPSLATRRLPHAAQPWSTSKPVSSPSRRCMCSSPTSSLGFSSMRSKRPSRSKLEAVESSATTQLNRSCLRPIPVSQLAAPSRSSSITQPQSFSALLRSSPRSGRGASYNFNRSASYSTSTKGQPSGSSSSYGSPTTFLAALAALSLAYNLYLLNAPTTASSSPSYTYSSPKLPFDYGTRSDFQSAISELKQYFASTNGGKWEDHVSEDDEELTRRGFDENGHMKSADGLKPSVVVWPTSTEDVVQIVKIANKYRMPVVPYSGGTSLEGHYTSPFAGISLDMSQMDKIIAVHAEDGDMVVQSGAKWEDINDHLAKLGHSLFFPLDPGPGATIGGMISTGCSGTNAVRYGTARGEHFLNMTIVLPNGDVIKTRQRARKSSAGFNVGSIVVGAEGTLGVVTEATIRLTPKLPSAVAIASFPNVEQASKAVGEILLKGVPVQCIELLDAAMMSAINDSGLCPRTYPVKDTLFFKLSGGEGAIAEARSIIKEAAKKFGSDPASFEYERDEEKANMIWQGRKYALWSVKALDTRESSRVWTTDVCVPLSALPRLVRETQADLQATGLKNAIVGHAGDGNFHGFLIFDSDSDEEVEKATKAVERMCERAQAMEGTCTGEHGIGTGKVRFLKNELGEGTLRLMKAVKLMFDPLNIMNPGKLYPLDDEEAGRN